MLYVLLESIDLVLLKLCSHRLALVGIGCLGDYFGIADYKACIELKTKIYS